MTTKTRLDFSLVGFCVVGVMVLALQFLMTDRAPQNQTALNQPHGVDEILDALTVSLPTVSSTNNREALNSSLRRRQEAIENLRTNTSDILPQLMQEVYAIGMVEATNRSAVATRTARLGLAFEVLGSNARPLLPKLENEFNAGRSIGPCVIAFQHIGGTDCGLILVSGLTNGSSSTRNAAMSVISSFATNREVAHFAVPPLIQLLRDDLQFSRALAASVLGSFRQEPEIVIPSLLEVAKNDSDFVVRVSAIKAIGRFGTNAAKVKSALESIAATDREPSARRMASVAIQAANGDITLDEVQ